MSRYIEFIGIALLMAWTGSVEAATVTWNGTTSVNWGDAGNWTGGTPSANDVVLTGSGSFRPTNQNISSLSIHSLTFDATTTSAITVSGSSITLTSSAIALTIASGAASHTIICPMILGANQTWSQGSSGTLTITGGITGTGNLILVGSGAFVLSTSPVNNTGSFTNQSVSAVTTTVSGGIGASVTAVTQDSTTSALAISGGLTVASTGTTLTNSLGTKALTVSGGVSGTGNMMLNNNSTLVAGITLTTASINNTGSITISGNGNGTTTITSAIGANVTAIINDGTGTGTTTFSAAVGGLGSSLSAVTENSATSALTISGAVTVASAGTTLTNSNSSGTALLTLSGGATGTGNLVLKNNSAIAGGVTLSTTSIDNAGSITNSGTSSGSTVISAPLGGAVTNVTQSSATSSLTLSGANTSFAGATALTTGTLRLGSATALGGNGSTTGTGGALTIAAGTILDVSVATTLTTWNAETWNGNFTYGGSFALSTGPGTVTLGAGTIQVSNNGANTLTVAGAVTGTSDLTLATTGAGGFTFSGTSVDNVGTITNAGSGAGVTTLSGGVGANVTSITQNSTISALTVSGVLTVASTGTTLTNSLGTKAFTVSGGVGGTGNLVLRNNSALAAGIALTTTSINCNGSITNSGTGSGTSVISAPIGVAVTNVKQNSTSSALTLSGANTSFAGTTTLSSGTLQVGSATALGGNGSATGTGGALSIAAGTVLDASAATTLTTKNAENWNGNFTFGGSFSLNTGPGTITLGAGALQVSNNGANALTVAGAVTGTSNLTLVAAAAGGFTFSGTSFDGTGTITNAGTGTGTSTFSGAIGANVTGITENSASSALTINGSWTVANSGTTLTNSNASGSALLTVSGGASGTGDIIINNDSAIAGGITISTTSVNNTGIITNAGSGLGTTVISAPLGAAVTNVRQNSATSPLTLSGVNSSFAGTTTLDLGTLRLGSATALGGNGSATGTGGTLSIAAGTVFDASATTNITTTNAENWNGNFTFGGSFSLNTGHGAITMTQAAMQLGNGGANTLTIAGTVSGTSDLTLVTSGAGGFIFSGVSVDNVGTITNSGTGAGTTVISGGVGANVTGIIQDSIFSATTISGAVTVASSGTTLTNDMGGKVLTVSGGVNGTGSLVLDNDSTLAAGIILSTTSVNLTGSVTNSGNASGSVVITAPLGAAVTNVTQNSASSALTLSGVNSSFAGTTTLTSGTLLLGSATALGGNGSATGSGGALSIAAGTVLDASVATVLTTSNAENWNGNFTFGSGFSLNIGAGTVTLGSSTLQVTNGGANTLTVAGPVIGTSNLTLETTAAGGFIFSGSGFNPIGSITNAGIGAGTITLSGGVGANVTAITENSATSALTVSGALVVASGGTTLANTNSTGTSLLTASGGVSGTGNLVLDNNSAIAGGVTLSTLSVDPTGTITNAGSGSGSTVISAPLGTAVTNVTQNSATSPLTLSGTNTSYGGSTALSAGTLLLGSATALGGNGSATGVGGALSIAGGAVLDAALANTTLTTINAENWNGNFAFGGSYNLNTGTGTVTLGASTLQVSNAGANTLTVAGSVTGTCSLTLKTTAAGSFSFSGLSINPTGVIINAGIGAGATTLSGAVGANVTAITESSTTSALTISGAISVASPGTTLTNSLGSKPLTVTGGVIGTGNLILNNDSLLVAGITLTTASINNAGTIVISGNGNGTTTVTSTVGANVTAITNTVSGSGTTTLSGSVGGAGSSLNAVTENSATSALTISGMATVTNSGTTLTNSNSSGTALLTLSGGLSGTGNAVLNNASAIVNGISIVTTSVDNTGTITNSGSGTGSTLISAPLGAAVTNVTQNSATSSLTLSGTNTNFAGTTHLSAGTLLLGSATALGGSGTTTGTGGALSIAAGTVLDASATTTLTTKNAENWNGNFTFGSSASLNTGPGAITLGASTLHITNSGANLLTVAGVVTGTGNLTLITTAAGGFTFAGINLDNTGTITNAGTGAGATTLSGGIGANVTAITEDSATSALTISGALTVSSSGTTVTNSNSAGSALLTVSGGVSGTGSLILNNNSAIAGGITLATTSIDNTGSITNSGTSTGSTLIGAPLGAAVTNVTQNSTTSSLTLSGANTSFAGTTALSSGTLFLGSATALGGNGTATGTGGALTITAGTVLDATSATTTLTTKNAEIWNGDFTFGSSYSLNLGTGAISLGSGNVQLSNAGTNTLTVGGAVSGTGNLTLKTNSTGGLTFSGVSVNNVGRITNSGAGAGMTALSGGVGANVTAIDENSTVSALTLSGPLTVASTGTTLTNSNSAGSALLTVSGGVVGTGNLALDNNSAIAGGITVMTTNVNNAGTITISGTGNGATLITCGVGANVAAIINAGTGTSTTTFSGAVGGSGSSMAAITENSTTSALTISGGLTVASIGTTLANSNSAGSAILTISGGITGTGNVTFSDNSAIAGAITLMTANINNAGTITVSGTGNGTTLITSGVGVNVTAFTNSGSGSGTTTVSGAVGGVGSSISMITQNSTTSALDISGAVTVATAGTTLITSASGTSALMSVSGGISGTGNVTLNNDSAIAGGITISSTSVNNTGTVTNSGVSTGSTVISAVLGTKVTAVVQNSGTSDLVLSGTNVSTGATTISNGILWDNGAINSSVGNISVAGSGTLAGSGSLAGVVTLVSSSNLSPGAAPGSIGALTVSVASPLVFNASSNVNLSISGSTCDQILCTGHGTMTLGGNLNLATLVAPAGPLTLISYPSGTISGIFANITGIPAGFSVNVSATAVTLVVGVPRTWTGLSGTGNWSNPGNWNGGSSIPNAGDSVTFPTVTNQSVTIDVSASVSSVTFDSTATYVFNAGSGKTLTVDGIVSQGGSGAVTMNNPLILAGVTNDFSGSGLGMVSVNGVISGSSGLALTGGFTLTLAGANTYSGSTTVSDGTLNIVNTSGSGTGTGSLTIGGSLSSGTPTLAGTGTITGPVSISGTATAGTLLAANLSTLTMSGGLTLGSGSASSFGLSGSSTTNAQVDASSSGISAGASSNTITFTGTPSNGQRYNLIEYNAGNDPTIGAFTINTGGSAVGFTYALGDDTVNQFVYVIPAALPIAAQSTLTPSNATITANGVSTQVLTVTAKDIYGNPYALGGATVAITQLSGTGTISTVTDNLNGTYSATVTSPTLTGSGVFVATLNGLAVTGGGQSQTQATVMYVPGAASQIVFSTQPSPTTVAGVAFAQQPCVSIEDAFGNVVTSGADATRMVSVTLSTGTGTLSGTSSMSAVAGMANFSAAGLTINLIGINKVLTATSTLTAGTMTATTSPAFTITVAPIFAAQSLLTPTSASLTANGISTQILTVTGEDAYGNLLGSGGATVSIMRSAGTGTINSTIDNGDGTYTATVTSPTATGSGVFVATVNSAPVESGTASQTAVTMTYIPGVVAAAQSTLTPVTEGITANGVSTQVLTVTAKDAYGNSLTSGGATVLITQSSGTGNIATVSDHGDGTYTATVTSPTVTGSGVFIGTVNGFSVQGGTGSQTQATVTYVAGAASQVVFATQPSSSTVAGVAFPQQPIVWIEDVFGNVVTSGADATRTVSLSLTTGTGTLNGTSAVSAVAGVADFTSAGLNINLVGANKALTATVALTAGSRMATTSPAISITVGAIAATQSTLTPTNASITADGISTQTVTVTAEDVCGNLLLSGGATVTITKTSGTGAIGSVTDHGDGTYSAVVTSPTATGAGVFVAAVSGSPIESGAASQTMATVTYVPGAAAAAQSTLTPGLSSIIANGTSTQVLTVNAVDVYGNLLTTGGASVVITQVSGGGSIGPVTDKGNGTYTATVTSPTFTSSGVFSATLNAASVEGGTGNQTTATVAFVAGPASQLIFATQPSSSTVAGVAFAQQPVVQIQDAFGNLVTTGSDATRMVSMTLTIGTGSLGGIVSLSAVAGVADFSSAGLNINLLGANKVLTATALLMAGSRSATTTPAIAITVGAAAAAQSTLVPTSSSITANGVSTQNLTVTAMDVYGNLLASGGATVVITQASGTGSVGPVTDNTNGTYTATVTSPTLASSGMFVATLGGLPVEGGSGSQTQAIVTYVAGPASQLVCAVQPSPSTVAGVAFAQQPVVRIEDAFGNIVTSGSDSTRTVMMTLTTGAGILSGTNAVTAISGVADFSSAGLAINLAGVNKVLTASATLTAGSVFATTSPAFSIIAGSAIAAQSTLTPTSSTITANGVNTQMLTVAAEDAYGNLLSNGGATVTITRLSGIGTISSVTDAGNGTYTANVTSPTSIGTGVFVASLNSAPVENGMASQATATLNYVPGAASAAQSTLTPTSVSIPANGSATLTLTVTALDAFDNPLTSGGASVTITLASGIGTIGPVTDNGNGTYAATVTAPTLVGSAVFVATVNGFPVQGGNGSQTQANVSYVPGPASQVVFATQPSVSTLAGVAFAQQPIVRIEDAFGNVVTSGSDATRTVTVALTTGVGTLGGTTAVNAVAGVADFSGEGLNINLAGTDKVLTASATLTVGSKTATTSPAFLITVGAANAAQSSLTPTSASITATGVSTQILTVTVADAYGNLLSSGGASVSIARSSGAGTISAVTDNGNGTYTASVTSPTTIGTGVFMATVNGAPVEGGTASQTLATVTYVTGPTVAAQSTLTPIGASITANGVSTQVMMVTAKDAFGNVQSTGGSTVTITSSSGTGSIGPVTDNANGTYTALVIAPTSIGSGVFVATLGALPVEGDTGSQVQATVSYMPGPASATASTLTPTAAGITANGSSTQVLTVTAADANGNLLSSGGATVSIALSSGIGTIGPVTDNNNGTYTAIVTSPTSLGSGVFVATMNSAPVSNGTAHQTAATLTYLPGPAAAAQSTLTATNASMIANGVSTQILTVTAKDAFGNLLTTGGATVTITQTSGTGTIGPVTDNANGTYTATLTAPTLVGSGVFVATLGSQPVEGSGSSQTQTTVTYAPGAASATESTLTPIIASIPANGTSGQVLTVTTEDAFGNLLTTGGATVTITQISGTGTIGPVIDHGNGTYTATVTAPTTVGSGVFAATLGGSPVKSGAGSQTQTSLTYSSAPVNVNLTWATPSAITYGTALSGAQLDAKTTPTVVGTFAYTPAAGTVLGTGIGQILSVTFTPVDTQDYLVTTTTVLLTVNQAPLSVTATSASRGYGNANPTFTGILTGVVNGDAITATYASSATTSTAIGTYGPATAQAIIPTLVDPGSLLVNYSVTKTNGTLTITIGSQTITGFSPFAAVTYGGAPITITGVTGGGSGQPVVFVSSKPAVATISGTTVTIVSAGTTVITASQTGNTDYSAATSVPQTLTVSPAALTVTANSLSMTTGGTLPTLTAAYMGFVNGDSSTNLTKQAVVSTTATSASPAGTYPIVVSAATDPNYTILFVPGVLTVTSASGSSTASDPTTSTGGGCGLGSGVSALVGILFLALRFRFTATKRREGQD